MDDDDDEDKAERKRRRRERKRAEEEEGDGVHDKRKRRKQANEAKADDDDGNNNDSDDQEEDHETLQGFVFNGQLLLKNNANTVFASERDEHGELVAIGTWDPERAQPEWFSPSTTNASPAPVASKAPRAFAFKVTDPQDHCETSIKAYVDVQHALQELASVLGKPEPGALRIYDPYFCTGKMKAHMRELGFPRVYNENEDFYARARVRESLPPHDCLVTNPPYSVDHIPRLLHFCAASPAPAFLLVPSYVVSKDYFDRYCKQNAPFYIVPRSGRYTYKSPANVDGVRTGRTAPFISLWIVDAKEHRRPLLKRLMELQKQSQQTWEVCGRVADINPRFLDDSDARKREMKMKMKRAG